MQHKCVSLVLAFIFCVADGHRIQRSSLTRQNLPGSLAMQQIQPSMPMPRHHTDVAKIAPADAMADTAALSAPVVASATPGVAVVGNSSDTRPHAEFEHFTHDAPIPNSWSPRLLYCILFASGLVTIVCCARSAARACSVTQRFAYCAHKDEERSQHVHNGRVVYEWGQTPKVATIYIKPPEGLKKIDLDIKIAARYLRVGKKGNPPFLREETFDLVNEEMSAWLLRDDGELQIFLHKVRKMAWPTILLHGKPFASPKIPAAPASPRSRLPTILEAQTSNQEKQPQASTSAAI